MSEAFRGLGGRTYVAAETDPVFSSWAQSVSSNYDSTYTTVQTNSADWGTPTGVTGSVIWFADDSPPTGYLECDGASLSTTTYADLFAVIAYTYGGSGASFTLPDLRGEFVRGWDNGRGVDSGRSFGSWQDEEFLAHIHDVGRLTIGAGGTARNIASTGGGSPSETESTGGSETRPRNIALLPCIKY